MILKAYKYRLYPNAQQTELLNQHFGSVRYIYNWALDLKKKTYEVDKKTLRQYDIQKLLPILKKELPWLKQVNSQSLQSTLFNLESAYTRFFKEKKGFPRFKSKKDSRHSFQCPQKVKVDFTQEKIQLPKIGKVKFVVSRTFEGKIKTVTISKSTTGKVYASVLVEVDATLPVKPIADKTQAIGIDVGLTHFATLSTGEKIANPRFLKRSLKRLKRLSRQLSKKQKGSNNRTKARIVLARQHEKVANQRQDFLHKVSTRLVRENQTLCIENLNIAGMIKNHTLARAISDVAWSSFVTMLEYKANWQGKNLIKIGRFDPSSKLCTCGSLNKNLTLKDRVWTCPDCHTMHDRDVLAANNIIKFAFTA